MILIIQNGWIETSIGKYLDEEYEIIKSHRTDVSKINLDKYSMVIILGGPQHVTHINEYPYLLKVIDLIKICINIKKPTLGICLGCQLVAYAVGCEVKNTGKLNIGYNTQILNFKNIFKSHYDHVIPCKSIDILDYFDSMVYFFKHNEYIYGIQCHPDIPPDKISKYTIDASINLYASENSENIDNANSELIEYILKIIRNPKKIE